MRSERDKMLAGELYDPIDPELVAARDRARDLCQALNATREAQQDERRRILQELFGAGGESVWMQPPFFCDYGSNILLGERVFFNFNCVVLDVCRGADRRLHPVRPGGPDLHRHAPDERRAAAEAGVRQADRDRLGRVGRRRGDPLPRRPHRLAVGHRRRAAWSRGTSPRGSSRPATPAGSSGRSPSKLAPDFLFLAIAGA